MGAIYALAFAFFWSHLSAAASATLDASSKKDQNKKIRITADKLIATLDAGKIEFIGNVKATRANTVITANRLIIIYTPAGIKSQTQAPEPKSIEKIIAQGSVRIIHDDIIAETELAEYTMKSAILVLTGEQSNVMQGDRWIGGTKFTLYRSHGKITVEGNAENRVKAVLDASPKDK